MSEQSEREARQARLAIRAEREARREARRSAREAEIDARIEADRRRMAGARQGRPMTEDEVNQALGSLSLLVVAICIGIATVAVLRLAESFMPPA